MGIQGELGSLFIGGFESLRKPGGSTAVQLWCLCPPTGQFWCRFLEVVGFFLANQALK